MRSIYEITGDYLTLLSMMDDPEIDQQAIIDTMESIDGELEEKADVYARILAQTDREADAVEAEAERLLKRAKTMRNNSKAMKARLKEAMIATGKTKFKTDLFTFSVRNNGGKTPIIFTVDPADLPEQFRKTRITYMPDDEVIRAYLDNGNTSDCFSYGERGQNLSIR